MQPIGVIFALHVLAAVIWAGGSLAKAHSRATDIPRVFAWQLGAAVVVVVTGGYLWKTFHASAFGRAEQVLTVGMAAAAVALFLQAAVFLMSRMAGQAGRVTRFQYPAALLLAVAVVTMAIARFV